MIVGEAAIMTRDVIKSANFYRWLLGIEGTSDDAVHQELIAGETSFAICLADEGEDIGHGGITLGFTVSDVDAEYTRLLSRGVTILDPPTTRPWGARNMRFTDPDGNILYFRQLL